jgi:uncharacterized RDD family membrane protein YckC
MKDCPDCGTANDESAAFCKSCGRGLGEPGGNAFESAAPPSGGGLAAGSGEPGGGPEGAPPSVTPPPWDRATSPPPPPQPPPYPPSGMPGGTQSGFGYRPDEIPAGPPEYGGFWVRFVAFMIDSFIIGFVFSFARVLGYGGRYIGIIAGIIGLLYYAAFVVYFILLIGYKGQTLGMMRLRVVRQDMTPVDMHTAVIRGFSMLLSALICYIGFIIAGFDDRKRALHDMIAKTYVLRY